MLKSFKFFKAVGVTILIIQMILLNSLSAFAYTGGSEELTGDPNIAIINGPIFEVNAGEENEVELTLKNLSPTAAKNILVMPRLNEIENNPLSLSFDSLDANISTIAPQSQKNIVLNVDVDRAAIAKTYSIDVVFSYRNQNSEQFETTSKIYVKVINSAETTSAEIKEVAITPDGLEIGGTGEMMVAIRNKNNIDLRNVKVSLTTSDSAIGITGESIKQLGTLQGGLTHNFNFNLLAGASASAGSYPVGINVTATDINGIEHSSEQIFYVSVGGSSMGKESDLEITSVVEPSGNFNINENFVVAFEVLNSGDAEATDVSVSATEFGGSGAIVPKSKGVVYFDEIAPGEKVPVSFTFAPTSNSESQNYSIEMVVTYTKNGVETSVKQYAGVDVTNPDSGDKTSKPKIIVDKYQSDPVIVQAGEEFDLTMSFLNTHSEKDVKNIKMYLTLSEETSADSETNGNIFTPVNSSNTFYFDEIGTKGRVEKVLRLYVVPDAQPKTYTLTVNFEYEDNAGNEYTATELLGINVKQATKIETSEIFVSPTSEIYMPIDVYFDIYNTGNVDISNLKVRLEGDLESSSKSSYLGNVERGDNAYYEGSFSVPNVGVNNVKLIMTYEDPSGEEIEIVNEYAIEGMEPIPMEEFDDFAGPETMPEESSMSTGMMAGIGVGVVIVIVVIAVVLKKRKQKKAEKYIDEDEDDDDSLKIE